MNKIYGSSGRIRLYAPFILAFFVFCAVLGAEYVIVESLLKQGQQAESDLYHGAIGHIIANINRYEAETGNSLSADSSGMLELMNPIGMNNYRVQIIPDSVAYSALMQSRISQGIALDPIGYDNAIIETSVGKTARNDIILLEAHEYTNIVNKKLRDISKSLIILLIIMIIITIVPSSLLIESHARRLTLFNSLAPVQAEKNWEILTSGIEESSTVAFLITSTDSIIISSNSFCRELLEIGQEDGRLLLSSVVSLPSDVRKEKPPASERSKRSITLQSMNGSSKQCLMEIVHFNKTEKTKSILYLFTVGDSTREINDSEFATGEIENSVGKNVKTHLIKSLIHDINNHLSGIIGLASVELNRPEPADTQKSFGDVLNSAERITTLCNDLQNTIAGVTEKKFRDPCREIDLIAEVLRKILPGRVEIEVSGSCRTAIKAGREVLREFFYGLALNSTGMMNGEGRIRIDVSERIPLPGNSIEPITPGRKICIRYSDGFIMPVALRDILSNRNYSLADIEREYGSTMGNAYKALNRLSGSIVFERGSGETVLCLLIDSYEQKTEVSGTSLADKATGDIGLSILVADEVEIVLRSTVEYLEHNGMTTSTAQNGDQAMELLRENHFDAAVLDLNMPGISTAGIIRYCQTSRPDMAIVITSGYDAPQGVEELIKPTSTDYLHKPHRPGALVDMIYSLLRRLKEGS